VLPPEGIDGLLVMRHEHATHAPGELLEIRKTAPSPDLVLQDTPEAFHGIEMVTAAGGQELQPQAPLPMGERRGKRVRPVDATTIDDHHHLFPGGGKDGHHLMDILPKPLGIKVRDDLIEDLRCPILDRSNDTEQDPAGDAAPGAIAAPGVAFERFLPFDLAATQGTGGEPCALRGAPPASPGEGKAPQDRFIGIQQDELAATGLVLERRQFDRGIGEGSGVGSKLPGGTIEAHRIFFKAQRTLSRPTGTPV
jgi:hypothetical protein